MNQEIILLTTYNLAHMSIDELTKIRHRLESVLDHKSGYQFKVISNMLNEINKEIILKRKMQKIDEKYDKWQETYAW